MGGACPYRLYIPLPAKPVLCIYIAGMGGRDAPDTPGYLPNNTGTVLNIGGKSRKKSHMDLGQEKNCRDLREGEKTAGPRYYPQKKMQDLRALPLQMICKFFEEYF